VQRLNQNTARFKKNGIKYIDYKDPDFLLKFINEQGRSSRRLTERVWKFHEKVAQAVKRAVPALASLRRRFIEISLDL